MKTIKLYKKLKKFGEGTANVTQSTGQEKFGNAMGYANTGLQIANMGNQMFGDQGNEFGVKDDGSAITGGVLSGAAQGASLGSMGGPIGTAIGAGVGGLYGGIKAYQGNEEAKARQKEFKKYQKEMSIKNSHNQWDQTLALGFKPQGNEFAQKYVKYGGLMKMGDGGKLKPAKVYTDKNEFLKAKQMYDDSLRLYTLTDKQRLKGDSNSDNLMFNNVLHNDKSIPVFEAAVRRGKEDRLKGSIERVYPDSNILRVVQGPPDYENEGSYDYKYNNDEFVHPTIKPIKVYNWQHGSYFNTNDNFLYKKPNQPITYKQPLPVIKKSIQINKPVLKTINSLIPQVPQKIIVEPIVERMSEMTPLQTIQPQVQDTLVQKPITMKTIYPSKPHVWNTYIPPTKKVERAPGLGGFNRIMRNGGNVQQLSKDAVEFKGNSHEMGGIKEPVVNGKVLEGAEVEGEETMQGNFIFSEELGFAQKHKPLAKMLGKLEKKAQSNPNDKINNSTIARVNSRIESLKKEQEETKEVLGIENDSQEMKNGGLYKKMVGGGTVDLGFDPYKDYRLSSPNAQTFAEQMYLNSKGAGLTVDGKRGPLTQAAANKFSNRPTPILRSDLSQTPQYVIGAPRPNDVDLEISGLNTANQSKYVETPLQGKEGSFSGSKTKVNWGNVASGLAPYTGVAANYMVNEQAKKLRLPQEKLTTPISLQRVNYDNQRVESDIQRNQLNKLTSRNLTNSAVASAVMAKNLGTTIREKNAINAEEMNTNRMISNEEVGKNKEIERLNNRTQVDNEDRFYNRDRDYLQNKGQIATNLSSMVQRQRADKMQYDLEDRKIDALSDADAGRGVFGRTGEDDRKKAKNTHSITSTERYGGKVKSSLRKKMNC